MSSKGVEDEGKDVLGPGVMTAVRGIGRREHGLRECGEAENAEEADPEGVVWHHSGHAGGMLDQAWLFAILQDRTPTARTSHAGGAWGTKG
jgi:hypothetical protein